MTEDNTLQAGGEREDVRNGTNAHIPDATVKHTEGPQIGQGREDAGQDKGSVVTKAVAAQVKTL